MTNYCSTHPELRRAATAYLCRSHQHLHALTRAGVLESVPGPRGGYRLARRPADISVLDVVEGIDGSEPAFTCTEIRRRGRLGACRRVSTRGHAASTW